MIDASIKKKKKTLLKYVITLLGLSRYVCPVTLSSNCKKSRLERQIAELFRET